MHVVNIYSKRVAPTALRRMRNTRKREAVDNGRKKRANKAGDGLLEGFAIQLPGGMNLKTPDTERHAPPRGAEPPERAKAPPPEGGGAFACRNALRERDALSSHSLTLQYFRRWRA